MSKEISKKANETGERDANGLQEVCVAGLRHKAHAFCDRHDDAVGVLGKVRSPHRPAQHPVDDASTLEPGSVATQARTGRRA
eukprot:6593180-Prymnesium_polylepis.2